MACADSFAWDKSNKIWHALIVLHGTRATDMACADSFAWDKSNKIWHALIVLHGTRATRYGMR